MRVLQVVGGLGVGGVETVVDVLSVELTRRGHHVDVLNLGVDGVHAHRLRVANVPVRNLQLPTRPGARNSTAVVRGLAEVRRTIAHGKYDIVQAHLFRTGSIVTPLAKLSRVPVVGTFHGIDSNRRQRRWTAALAKAEDVVVAVSTALADRMSLELSIPRERIQVVSNGVDEHDFARRPRRTGGPGGRDDRIVVGSLGRFHHRKGQHLLVRSFARAAAREPRLRLVLIGDGPTYDEVAALSRDLGVADRVEMPGVMTDPAPCLATFDVLAAPGGFEGFNLSIVEAMFTGLPVIATAAGGPVDIVVDGTTGLLLAEGDLDGWADAMVSLAGDAGRRAAMGEAGYQRAAASFTAEAMAAGYEDVYSALVGKRRDITATDVR